MFLGISKANSIFIFLTLASTTVLIAQLRIPGTEALKSAVIKPAPEYTRLARQMKVTGKVEVEATVGTDGTVEKVTVLTGNPLLTASAIIAVKKWKFAPFTTNGEPARALTVLTFDFK